MPNAPLFEEPDFCEKLQWYLVVNEYVECQRASARTVRVGDRSVLLLRMEKTVNFLTVLVTTTNLMVRYSDKDGYMVKTKEVKQFIRNPTRGDLFELIGNTAMMQHVLTTARVAEKFGIIKID